VKALAVLSGVIAFLCLVMGVITLFGVLPEEMIEALPEAFDWTAWFWLSALLFLASIACSAGGRGGGGEY